MHGTSKWMIKLAIFVTAIALATPALAGVVMFKGKVRTGFGTSTNVTDAANNALPAGRALFAASVTLVLVPKPVRTFPLNITTPASAGVASAIAVTKIANLIIHLEVPCMLRFSLFSVFSSTYF